MNFVPNMMPSGLMLIIIVLGVYLLIAMVWQKRSPPWHTEQKVCPGCGAAHPHFAQFCKRCGRKLE